MAMPERLLFLTGHLAEPRLRRQLEALKTADYDFAVVNIGVKVAALMTEAIIKRRLPTPIVADRVIFPGRAGLDAERLSCYFGVAFARGPDEIVDIPAYLGHHGRAVTLDHYDIRIFSEIVDAARLETNQLLDRARRLVAAGADVIDLGCVPGVSFPHLETVINALKAEKIRVSVDSGDPRELRRGALAGADFLLSLTEATLDIIKGTIAVPVLIPEPHGDLVSLIRAAGEARARGISFLLDPILDPIHAGFSASLARYMALREALPDAEIMMGTGNVTELTDADSAGVTALLLGACSELNIRNVLTVQVSPHTRCTLAEHDIGRRIMYAARADGTPPRLYSEALLQVHDRAPWPLGAADLAEESAQLRDGNFRIAVAEDGIHVFNNRLHHVAREALAFFPLLNVDEDGAHAFYLGAELAKAEIAFRLGKRYVQDAPLDFGIAAPIAPQDRTRHAEIGHTLRGRGDVAHP
jgi:dihydropteroate synthase-like protein